MVHQVNSEEALKCPKFHLSTEKDDKVLLSTEKDGFRIPQNRFLLKVDSQYHFVLYFYQQSIKTTSYKSSKVIKIKKPGEMNDNSNSDSLDNVVHFRIFHGRELND